MPGTQVTQWTWTVCELDSCGLCRLSGELPAPSGEETGNAGAKGRQDNLTHVG